MSKAKFRSPLSLICEVGKPIVFPKSPVFSPFFALTSQQHHTDCENHLRVGVGRHVAEAQGHEPRKHKIEGGGIAALQMTRGAAVVAGRRDCLLSKLLYTACVFVWWERAYSRERRGIRGFPYGKGGLYQRRAANNKSCLLLLPRCGERTLSLRTIEPGVRKSCITWKKDPLELLDRKLLLLALSF